MPEKSLPPVELGSRLSASLVYAYDATVAKEALGMAHPDPPYTAWYVRNGNVSIVPSKKDQTPVSVSAGQWLILPPRPRAHTMSSGTHLLSIRFHLWQPGGWPVFASEPPLVLMGEKRLVQAGRLLVASVKSMAQPHRRLALLPTDARQLSPPDAVMEELRWRAAFCAWMHAFLSTVLQGPDSWRLQAPPTTGSPLDRTLRILSQKPLHMPLRLRDLAKESGLSASHLKRLFASEGGLSPAHLWRQRKWMEACRLLRQTTLPLKHIASDLGFRSPAHFSTWFKQRTGQPPLEYRNSSLVDA
jgi:AraC-like DNA-binding protein